MWESVWGNGENNENVENKIQCKRNNNNNKKFINIYIYKIYINKGVPPPIIHIQNKNEKLYS